jgi:hypothetical protein
MPLLRYFVFVGGALLALLFISDAVLPKQPLPSFLSVASSEVPPARIHSDQKWPERIVFDTRTPVAKPVIMAEARPAPAPQAQTTAVAPKAMLREAFAQLTSPAPKAEANSEARLEKVAAKAPEAVKPQPKRKVAKARPARPLILVAQQPRFGLFESTW